MIIAGLIFCYFLQNFIYTSGMLLLLQSKYGFWLTQLIWLPNTALVVVSRVFPDVIPGAAIIWPILYMVTQILLQLIMFKDSLLRKILAFFFAYACLTLGEIFTEMLNLNLFAEMHALMYENTHPVRMVIMLEAAISYLIAMALVSIIWHRNSHLDFQVSSLMPALMVPLGQVAFLVAIQEYVMFADRALPLPVLFSMSGMMIAEGFWIYWIMERGRYEQLQRDLERTRQETALEKFHNEQVQDKRRMLKDICRSYEAQLTEILSLLQMHYSHEAAVLVDGLAASVRATKETPYCEIPVVNAVLTSKNVICEEKGIALDIELDMEDDGRDPLELCSVFGNLMDNAIEGVETWAAEKVFGEEAARWIRLTAANRGGYLVIKTENPAVPPSEMARSERGYGRKILKAIAEKYQGDYVTDYHEERFTAVVTLENSEEGKN